MRNYIDPVYLAITEEAWNDRVQAFYTKLFNENILPDLIQKRAEWCPCSGVVSHQELPSFDFKNHWVPEEEGME